MRALITGAQGQDGRLLASLLSGEGYEIIGVDCADVPDGSSTTLRCNVADAPEVDRLIDQFRPDEVYHLAAAHHSSERATEAPDEIAMVETNFISTQNLIASILKHAPMTRLLLACSSQMYTARCRGDIVNEATPPDPATFYGLTKRWSWDLLKYARLKRGLHGCAAILFNHESPLRGPDFVTRKITRAAAQTAISPETTLALQTLEAETDWSSAKDVVAGLKAILAAPLPSDYVLASGTLHSVRDVIEIAFRRVGVDWRKVVTSVASAEAPVLSLVGDARKAKRELGWAPSMSFQRMIEEMVESDLSTVGCSG